jgi:hypothetical protein
MSPPGHEAVSGASSVAGRRLAQDRDICHVEARRGIAATAALSPGIMPSAPGRTTVSVNGGFFHGETGVGVGVSHRLNLSMPVMLYGSYANAGGDGHVGRIGGAFEF